MDSQYRAYEVFDRLFSLRRRISFWREVLARPETEVEFKVGCTPPPDFIVPPCEKTTLGQSAEGRFAILDRIADDELEFEQISDELKAKIGVTGEQLLDGLS